MVEAMRNQAFEVNLPLLDTSVASILSVTKAFSGETRRKGGEFLPMFLYSLVSFRQPI